MNTAIGPELRVAFSRVAQPVWVRFRIVNRTRILDRVALFQYRRWFRRTLAGLAKAGTLVHFLDRWNVRVGTRPRRGRSDVEAARDQ